MSRLLKHLHGSASKIENDFEAGWVAWLIRKKSWCRSQIATTEEHRVRKNALVSKQDERGNFKRAWQRVEEVQRYLEAIWNVNCFGTSTRIQIRES